MLRLNRGYAPRICSKAEFQEILKKDEGHTVLAKAVEELKEEEKKIKAAAERLGISVSNRTPTETKLDAYKKRLEIYRRRIRNIKQTIPSLRDLAHEERKALRNEAAAVKTQLDKKLRTNQTRIRNAFFELTKYQSDRYQQIINDRKQEMLDGIKYESEEE